MNLTYLSRLHKFPLSALRYRIDEKGLSLREALSRPFAPGRERGPDTIKQRARAAGKSETSVRRRLDLGMSLGDAVADAPKRRPRQNMAIKVRAAGVGDTAVRRRMVAGMSLEAAIEDAKLDGRRHNGRKRA